MPATTQKRRDERLFPLTRRSGEDLRASTAGVLEWDDYLFGCGVIRRYGFTAV